MNIGIGLLIGIGLVFGTLFALQAFAARMAKRMEGEAAPAVDGPLGDRMSGNLLVWFHSETCGPCKAMEPFVRQLEAEGKAEIVDVHKNLSVAQAFGVMATPTTVHVRDGQILTVRPGVMGKAQMEAMLTAE